MTTPTQISRQGDIEVEAFVSAAIIDEFNAREEDFMNLRVGIDIPIYPNMWNIVVLKDITGDRDPIITQCHGFYDPDDQNRSAGVIPYVQLSREIRDLPEQLLEELVAADPRILEAASDQGTVIVDVTTQGEGPSGSTP